MTEYREEHETAVRTIGARICCLCFGRVDQEGESVSECAWVQSSVCESCGGCLCDGSC